jgi:hypothetical protein
VTLALDVRFKRIDYSSFMIIKLRQLSKKMKKVHCEVPNELSNLTIAEKMLIQRVSPLIPVIHKKWYVRIQGAYCHFFSRHQRSM